MFFDVLIVEMVVVVVMEGINTRVQGVNSSVCGERHLRRDKPQMNLCNHWLNAILPLVPFLQAEVLVEG